MDVFFTLLAYAGLVAVCIQTWPYIFSHSYGLNSVTITPAVYPMVSIIIPARNEEKTLPGLLQSLLQLNYSSYEIIVVDDQSEDDTFKKVAGFPVTLVKAPPKPEGWVGKNWACHIGTRFAKGSLLLFTDADTVHAPESLLSAMQFMHKKQAVLLSAPSFHTNTHWWEKIMGPFHFLVTVAVTPFNTPTQKRPYAIGQYLLFDAAYYYQTGGHAAIKSSLAEDVDLARTTLAQNQPYCIYTGAPLYQVQMYHSFSEFISGWSRLLRLGMQCMDTKTMLISSLAIFALTSFLAKDAGLIRWIPTLGTLVCMWFVLKRAGNYNLWSVLLFPLPVLLFMILGLQAILSRLLNLPYNWRGRLYKQPAQA